MNQQHDNLAKELVIALEGCAPDIMATHDGPLDWKIARDMIDTLLFHCKNGEQYSTLSREEKDQILDQAFPKGVSWT